MWGGGKYSLAPILYSSIQGIAYSRTPVEEYIQGIAYSRTPVEEELFISPSR
jgi:hypothetical protein